MSEEYLGKLKRTCMCAELGIKDSGRRVTVFGFVQKYRNLGSIEFIDLRDRTGIVQLSFDSAINPEAFEKAVLCRNEFVLAATGIVMPRGEKNKNPNLLTGEIEISVTDLKILSEAETAPFNIVDDVKAGELLRYKYRYLDLRRPSLQNIMAVRDKIFSSTVKYMSSKGFLYIETPFLGKSTPEGARDYLVPSRLRHGEFYALPQSPQLYKQLLMISGADKYYQIAKCFRDEDLRANRQPEFTQIDIEMSFVDDIDSVMSVAEGLIRRLFKDAKGIDLPRRFRRIKYKEAMERFGSDKPDTRFGLELQDLSALLKKSDFSIFKNAAVKKGMSVRGINAKGLSGYTRKELDALTAVVKEYGGKGLSYISLKADGAVSPFKKFLTDDEFNAIINAMGGETGDLLLIAADKDKVVFDALGALRLYLAKKENLIEKDSYDLLWVTHFPLFEYNEEEKRLVAVHHPFTAPLNEHIKYLDKRPLKVLSKAYDLVINGQEAGGGSIRIHSPALQEKIFETIGLSEKDIKERFGFFVEAFRYGAPPHGGLAFGLDRLVMLLAGTDNIKDVIAFPKNQNAACLMSDAPSEVEPKQTDELGLDIKK